MNLGSLGGIHRGIQFLLGSFEMDGTVLTSPLTPPWRKGPWGVCNRSSFPTFLVTVKAPFDHELKSEEILSNERGKGVKGESKSGREPLGILPP